MDCNSTVKFGALLGRARRLYGCDAVATGHYARRDTVDGPDGHPFHRLRRGVDRTKDQAYFLYGLRQDQLAHAWFPLGELTKVEVRDLARERGLATADKPESMEICFVPERAIPATRCGSGPAGCRSRDLRSTRRTAAWSGRTQGAAGYTVGQRRGLGIALGEPRYVSRVDPVANTIVLARRADLETRRFAIADVTFVRAGRPQPTAGRSPHGRRSVTARRQVRASRRGGGRAAVRRAAADPAGRGAVRHGRRAGSWRPRSPCGPRHRARPASSTTPTTPTSWSAAAASCATTG